MANPEQPFQNPGGVEYTSPQNSAPPVGPYAPVEYPESYPPVNPYPMPPFYAAPYPGPVGYPGYPGDPYNPYRQIKPLGTNGKAVAALVTSVAGLILCGLPSIVGVILGIIAMGETKRTGQDGYGVALAGVVVGVSVIVLMAFFFAIHFVVGNGPLTYSSY